MFLLANQTSVLHSQDPRDTQQLGDTGPELEALRLNTGVPLILAVLAASALKH